MSQLIEFYWPTYQLFPYERRLGKREVRALFGKEPVSFAGGVRLATNRTINGELDRLTYFHRITVGAEAVIPLQARLESTAAGATECNSAKQSRQSTRYSSHGIHEYRGKFNPQIVRAIGNVLKLPHEASVLDPFCGSGTTLVECAHIGWNALGLDLNPLA